MAEQKHKDRQHAKLSASGADKWLNCPVSVKLEEAYPSASSTYADEGTLAHEFGDIFLRWKNDEVTEGRYLERVAELRKNPLYYKGMESEVAKYTDYVLTQFMDAQILSDEAELWVERRLDFSKYVKEGFGTGDSTVLGGRLIEVVDLKFGQGVEVSAVENPQLKLYGLGALLEIGLMNVDTVRLTIVQPRLNNISTFEISADALIEWAENEVRPKALLAYEGKGEAVAGKHCRWCNAKATCRAFAGLALEAAKHEFADPLTLDDAELLEAYEKGGYLAQWLKAVDDHLHETAKNGKKWAGYKLVEGKTKRKWGDAEAVIDALADFGLEPKDYLKPQELKGITEVGDLVSVDYWQEQIAKHVIKPVGPPCLVKESDKRPALGVEQAKADFAEPYVEELDDLF